MALKDLQSNLSWYGTNPGPYKPSTSVNDTKYQLTDNKVSVSTNGFSSDGSSLITGEKIAADSFKIDNGLASRAAQLGDGGTFPIGPEGQVHEFDKQRTGFNFTNKYSDSYGTRFGTSGLADTYTKTSPIDDMYNKFKVRDEVHDPYGYAKPPYILRGIQRNGSSDPQRWGPGIDSIIDIPRGGPVTSVNRAVNDAIRLGKMLIRPNGIAFLAKQVGLQLTNPNTEGPGGKASPLGLTKLYDPISSITNAVGGTLGLRTDRHFPPLVRSAKSTYEGIVDLKRGDKTNDNRLVQIRKELLGEPGEGGGGGLLGVFQSISSFLSGDRGTPIQTLSGLTGPGSLLGIGSTTIRRYANTSLTFQKEQGGLFTDLKKDEYHRWKYGTAYEKTEGESNINTQEQIDTTDGSLRKFDKKSEYALSTDSSDSKTVGTEKTLPEQPFTNDKPYIEDGKKSGANTESDLDKGDKSLKNTYTNWPIVPSDRGGRGDALPGGGIDKLEEKNIIDDYTRMSYGAIPNNRTAKTGNKNNRIEDHQDFRDSGQSQELKIGWDDDNIDVIDKKVEEGLIKFEIGGIKFKAYLGSLNETFAPGWDGQQDQGRADSRYLYNSFERTISTDFIVPVMSKDDYSTIWGNLQKLAQLTYPKYGSQGFYGQSTKLTIGDMYKDKDVIITDLSYDWDNETPWEIEDGKQSPMYTNVSISFTMLDNKPQHTSKIYGNA